MSAVKKLKKPEPKAVPTFVFHIIPEKTVKEIRSQREKAREAGKKVEVPAHVRRMGESIPAVFRYADFLRAVEKATSLAAKHDLHRNTQCVEWARRAMSLLGPMSR